MKFVWDEEDADIGHYDLYLYDDDGKKLENIWIRDYSNPWNVESDKDRGYRREYAYDVGYCNGYSMNQGFDKDEDFYHRTGGGYQGIKTHTLEDIKKWCENYLAQMYIGSYYDALKSLPEKERRCKWFEEQGFSLEEKK